MKKLTGKAKEAFVFWLHTHSVYFCDCENVHPSMINAIIIEWLDGVNIHIEVLHSSVIGHPYPFTYRIVRDWERFIFAGIPNKLESRQEATDLAITKAVEFYNSKK